MAKKEETIKTTQYKGVARQHIKYKGEYIAPGQEFQIDEKDKEELKQYADIEAVEAAEEKDGEAKDGE